MSAFCVRNGKMKRKWTTFPIEAVRWSYPYSIYVTIIIQEVIQGDVVVGVMRVVNGEP
jgi:hypothetical protein